MKITWIDCIVILLLILFFYYSFHKVENVLVYKWNWAAIPSFFFSWDAQKLKWTSSILTIGFFITFKIAIFSSIFAAIIGVTMGILLASRKSYLRWFVRTYVEFVRNIPPLVFLFLFYFFLSSQLSPLLNTYSNLSGLSDEVIYWIEWFFIDISLIDNFISGVLCLALFEAAYVAEIVQAGIRSIGKEQAEAAASLGLNKFIAMRLVILPQALYKVIPPLAGQFISLVKDSTILSIISIQELTFVANQVISTTRLRFETWLVVGLIYFIICFLLSLLFRFLEKKTKKLSY